MVILDEVPYFYTSNLFLYIMFHQHCLQQIKNQILRKLRMFGTLANTVHIRVKCLMSY